MMRNRQIEPGVWDIYIWQKTPVRTIPVHIFGKRKSKIYEKGRGEEKLSVINQDKWSLGYRAKVHLVN